jgi:cellobiose transport system substrate-binding protein
LTEGKHRGDPRFLTEEAGMRTAGPGTTNAIRSKRLFRADAWTNLSKRLFRADGRTKRRRGPVPRSFTRRTRRGLGLALPLAAAVALAVAGCSGGPAQPVFKRVGPLITLRVGLYGDPGYRQAGLYAQYERLHPNIKIVQQVTASQASYWPKVAAGLKSGAALDDIQAVPVSDISAVTGPLSGDVVRLNTLGGVAAGNSAFADDWLPWVARQATDSAGNTYALGAEIGPVAMCYRTDLLAEAGLPTNPAVLARDWATWPDYLRLGQQFRARIPQGPSFTDSVTSIYNAMTAQAPEQYYNTSGRVAVSGNPAVKTAWGTAVQAAQDGLSAKLVPQSAAWDQGVTRGSFATAVCPAWMLRQISHLAGSLGSGQWNVTSAPGGSGNSGGFYLVIPRTSAHQQAAFGLASYLAGPQAGAALFRTQGDFPANLDALTAVDAVTDPYFSGARVGKIFGDAADLTPAVITGPASEAIGSDLDADLSQVEIGHVSPDIAWQAALRQATAAAAP